MYGQDSNLDTTLFYIFRNYPAMFNVFNDLPKQVEAEGQFDLDPDMEFTWDGDYFRVSYDSRSGNKLSIHRIDFIKQDGFYCFSVTTFIDADEANEESLEKLESIVADTYDPFDLEDFEIELDSSFGDVPTLTIDCWDGSIDCLPKMKEVNKLVKRILKKAGVILKEL